MIRYFRPDSSDCSRFMCVAHSTYSGIDSSSKPMKSTTRSLAATSTTMPRIEVSSSAKYSPSPASAVATERHDSSTAAMPPATKIIVSVSVRLSTTIAEAMIASLTSHCQTPSPAVTPERHQRQHRHDRRARMNAERARPTSSTTHAPAVSATNGRQRLPVDLRPLDGGLREQSGHRPTTACTVDLTASSPDSSASCGYSAKARIASTSGTSTSPSRNGHLKGLHARPDAVVHRADVHPQRVDRGQHDADRRDDRDRLLDVERAQQDQELAREVRRARHRQRRQRGDQEQHRQHRRAERDPAVVADVLRALGALGQQHDHEEQRRDDQPVVDRLQQRALRALARGVDGEDPERDEPELRDRRVAEDQPRVGLREGLHRAVQDRDDRQDQQDRVEVLDRGREQRQHELQEAVGRDLGDHAGEERQRRQRHRPVRVRHPAVERERRHLDQERQRERDEDPLLRALGQRVRVPDRRARSSSSRPARRRRAPPTATAPASISSEPTSV